MLTREGPVGANTVEKLISCTPKISRVDEIVAEN